MIPIQRWFICVTVLTVLFDQLTKASISYFQPHWQAGFFQIALTTNTGAAFGILQEQNLLLIGISIVAIAFFIIKYKEIPQRPLAQTAAALVLGGIIGNLADRLFRGYVIDFLDFSFWPSFNIADSAITLGVIGLIWYLRKK